MRNKISDNSKKTHKQQETKSKIKRDFYTKSVKNGKSRTSEFG